MSKPWSRLFADCKICHTTNFKHVAKGVCNKCYMEQYSADHAERMRELKHAWYVRQGGKIWAKLDREQKHFDGMREPVLRRDGYRCTTCGSTEKLCVHHKDGNGRGSPNPNNELSNLKTLCRKHHLLEHRAELLAAKNAYFASYWSPKFKSYFCADCLRSNVKHTGNGRCGMCNARRKQQNHD